MSLTSKLYELEILPRTNDHIWQRSAYGYWDMICKKCGEYYNSRYDIPGSEVCSVKNVYAILTEVKKQSINDLSKEEK